MIFSVIIPTYNRVDKLEKCLAHITKQSFDINNYEIIIVDDCSKDNTEEFCNNYVKTKQNVRYIRNEVNKGRCVTRNKGIRASIGKYLVFLDNDLITDSNFLQAQLDYFNKFAGKKIAIINDTTYPPEILKKSNFGTFYQSRAIGYRSKSDMAGIDYDDVPSNYFAGGGSSVKREDAFSIGLFDESLGKYGSEDELFGYRFIKSGGKIVFCDKTKIIHNDSDILPRFWKTKFMELGKHGLRTLLKTEPDLIHNTLYNYLMPINNKKDSLSTKIKKTAIKFVCLPIFRIPVENYVFYTDHIRFLNIPKFHRYLTVVWMKNGFDSDREIEEVKY